MRAIVIASDHAGVDLKRRLIDALGARGDLAITDLGPAEAVRCDYPDFAAAVCRALQSGEAQVGVLVCGTGIGMSIAANKFAGVRAALVHDATTARFARQHNDANVLCLGARVIGEAVAIDALAAFLDADFEGGRHAGRLARIATFEQGV